MNKPPCSMPLIKISFLSRMITCSLFKFTEIPLRHAFPTEMKLQRNSGTYWHMVFKLMQDHCSQCQRLLAHLVLACKIYSSFALMTNTERSQHKCDVEPLSITHLSQSNSCVSKNSKSLRISLSRLLWFSLLSAICSKMTTTTAVETDTTVAGNVAQISWFS